MQPLVSEKMRQVVLHRVGMVRLCDLSGIRSREGRPVVLKVEKDVENTVELFGSPDLHAILSGLQQYIRPTPPLPGFCPLVGKGWVGGPRVPSGGG